MNIKQIDFQKHADSRGMLVVAEYEKEIPYPVNRIYYIFGVGQNTRRGFHSHKKLQEICIPIHGKCKIMVTDGNEKQIITLDDPSKGLYLANNVWREIYDFSQDCVLLVLASEKYSEDDYIRSYDEFKEWQRTHKSNH